MCRKHPRQGSKQWWLLYSCIVVFRVDTVEIPLVSDILHIQNQEPINLVK